MGKRREFTGGLLSPADALYHAVHDYQHGGLPALAARMGKSDDVLRKKVDPDYTTHKVQFVEFIQIFQITKDERLINAINSSVGVVWHFESECSQTPGDMDVLITGNGLVGSAVAVLNELVDALEDGDVSDSEMSRLEDALQKLGNFKTRVRSIAKAFRSED